MKPRILFISQYFFPEAVSNNKVVAQLLRLGFEVDVWTAVPNYPVGKFFDGYGLFKQRKTIHDGAFVERLPVIPRGNNSKLKLMINAASFAVSGSFRAMWLKKGQYDLVFCSLLSPGTMAIPAAVASKKMKSASVCWIQDLWPQTPIQLMGIKNPIAAKLLKAVFRWVYQTNSAILIQSKAYRNELSGYADDKELLFFPNTIDDIHKPMPKNNERREAMGFSKKDTVIVYAGNMGTGQNLDIIIDAVLEADDKSLKFVFLGDGRDKARIEERVAGLNLQNQFYFLGRVSQEEVSTHLADADAAIVTLRAEPALAPTIPYRIQTFMGCGKILLASIQGEPARIIEKHNCGFVSHPESAAQLAQNFARLARLSTKDRAEMAHNSRNYAVKNFSEDAVYSDLDELLRRLIKQTR